jgi:hypothetical protein
MLERLLEAFTQAACDCLTLMLKLQLNCQADNLISAANLNPWPQLSDLSS